MRTVDELENIVQEKEINISLDFAIRLMKVLEISEEAFNFMENVEQKELTGEYSEKLLNEIKSHVSEKELVVIEENGILSEL